MAALCTETKSFRNARSSDFGPLFLTTQNTVRGEVFGTPPGIQKDNQMRQLVCATLLCLCALAANAQWNPYPPTGPQPHVVTANYQMTPPDQILVVNCATGCTVTLPDCTKFSYSVTKYSVIDASPMTLSDTPSNIVYVQPFTGQGLASGNPYVLLVAGQTTRFEAVISNGACWWTF
jgi:hypothetical protein